MTAPALTFLAPPAVGDDTVVMSPSERSAPSARRAARPAAGRATPASAIQMTRGAREAATGMKVSDADILRCLDAPEAISPDPNTPERTRFRRGNLLVVTGADGTVLRVNRRNR